MRVAESLKLYREKTRKMNVLVLCTDYPNNTGGISMAYIRTRNVYYKKYEIDVDVLNFSAKNDYIIDDIKVYTLQSSNKNNRKEYDILICHAPNLRNHYLFLKQKQDRFNKIIFFFHGHEVLKLDEAYSKPYSYMRKGLLKTLFQKCYDLFKLTIWRFYFPKLSNKSEFIFVSNWMYDEFRKWTKIKPAMLNGRIHIIHNSIGKDFENESYNGTSEKIYDFITIRPHLDGSKYAIDVVNNIAANNPKYKFLVVGKGDFFSHYTKASNIIYLPEYLNHNRMIDLLNQSRCALMPTRTDAQGVSVCEMATFGIPLITSDIPVCHEIFSGFNNVAFIDNENVDMINIDAILESFSMEPQKKNMKYFFENTIAKEINLIHTPPPY